MRTTPRDSTLLTDRRRLGGRARSDLLGRAVLLIEDDFYQARDTQQALEHSGARVLGPVRDSTTALRLISEKKPSCAIVDINLGEGAQFDLAFALAERGIPFMFMTGLDVTLIPEPLAHIPVMRKPVDVRSLLKLTSQISARRRI